MNLTNVPSPGRGRCSSRVCYAPHSNPLGERSFGHFVMDSDTLSRAVLNQIPVLEVESEDSWEGTLYRWLRDSDRQDQELTALPIDWPGLETAVEQTFLQGRVRVFCLCCNRTYQRDQTSYEQAGSPLLPSNRYFCPNDHLLMSTPAEAESVPAIAVAA